jgi:hypothetical protein
MGDKGTFSGLRCFMTTDVDDQYHMDISMYYTGSSKDTHVWPYPRFYFCSHSQASRKYFREKLTSTLFGKIHISDWGNGAMKPDGTVFFFDCGVSINVLTLTMFFIIENVTGQEIKWFDTLGWQDRNSVWGVQWTLNN